MIWFIRFMLAVSYAGFAMGAVVLCEDLLVGKYGFALLMLFCLVVNAACVASNTNILERENFVAKLRKDWEAQWQGAGGGGGGRVSE